MEAKTKRTLEIKILSEAEATKADHACMIRVWENGEYAGESLTFESTSGFFEVFNSHHWDIVLKLQALGKTSIRPLAKQVGREMRRVHDDVKFLIAHGIIDQDAKGVCVPYDSIHAEFTLKAEALRAPRKSNQLFMLR